jgi:hypothetical protein
MQIEGQLLEVCSGPSSNTISTTLFYIQNNLNSDHVLNGLWTKPRYQKATTH